MFSLAHQFARFVPESEISTMAQLTVCTFGTCSGSSSLAILFNGGDIDCQSDGC